MWIAGHTVQRPVYLLVNFGAFEEPYFLHRSFNIDPISTKLGDFVNLHSRFSSFWLCGLCGSPVVYTDLHTAPLWWKSRNTTQNGRRYSWFKVWVL